MLFGNCRDDFVEKMQKLGTEEKEELKKAVEEAGLLAKEENNSQENIWTFDSIQPHIN